MGSSAAKDYYELTKGGLVFGNLIPVMAGFLLGTSVLGFGIASISWPRFVCAMIGMALVMASGSVLNNYIDRDIDAKMERTKHRALIEKRVSDRNALVFGVALGVAGLVVVGFGTEPLAVAAAAAGLFFYVCVYTLWTKRRSPYGTVAGAIAGAMPTVVGYAAASARVDLAAFLLFLIMFTWQMPHFFAISIRRREDYEAAKIPVMPVAFGVARTKASMLIYIVEFMAACAALAVFGYAGPVYLAVVLALGIAWFVLGMRGLRIADGDDERARRWAKMMFLFSLIVMVATFAAIAVGAVI